MKGVLKIIIIFVGISAVVVGIWAGYRYAPDWTGFGEYRTPADPDIERARRLWDWLELLIVPFVLALGVWWLDRRQKKTEREFEQARLEKDREIAHDRRKQDLKIAKERRKQDIKIAEEKRQDTMLEAYFDRMTVLLLEEGLRDSEEGDEVRKIARTRTLAVLRRLDRERKAEVVQFLWEADLIQVDSPIVDLRKADLSGTVLLEADLLEANLQEAVLSGANLCGTDLSGADLRGANLWTADLGAAVLRKADLSGTVLLEAVLREADLRGAGLAGAVLMKTVLSGADLRGADLEGALLMEIRHLDKVDFRDVKLKGAQVWAGDVEALKRAGADVDGIEVLEESDEA